MNNDLVEKGIIPAVNFHLWKPCNFKCKFCFGTFNDVSPSNLKKDNAINIIKQIADYGFKKITFSGGEPTLCPYLEELITLSKKLGLVTSIVTNGSQLNKEWLRRNASNLDWIALSIDSILPTTNMISGRISKNTKMKLFNETSYLKLIQLIKDSNIKIKINTVVSNYNKNENLNGFIEKTKPLRWKIFQALPIEIQNDKYKEDFLITKDEFENYLKRHQSNKYIKESNYDMKGSYVMIDPLGRFFQNTEGKHKYSKKINNVEIELAIKDMDYSFKKFINRNGLYRW